MRLLPTMALLLALPLAAQAPELPKPHFHAEKLGEGAYLLAGGLANIGLLVTDKHAVLVDDGLAGQTEELIKAVRAVTDRPIKYVINTHYHFDHTGGNAALAGQVEDIVATAALRQRLEAQQAKGPAEQRGGLPTLVLGQEGSDARELLQLHVDGMEIHALHPAGKGHTDGDIAVGVPSARVIYMGDLYFNGMTPFIDLQAGGSLKAMRERADEFLAWLPEGCRIVPGHGPVASKQDYARYRDFLKAVEAHVAAHPGKSGAELDAAFDHKAWSDFKDLKPFMDWAKFFDVAAGRP